MFSFRALAKKIVSLAVGSFAVGSNWSIMAEKGTTVGTGTAGQVLKTNSAGTGTEWGSGGMILGVHYSGK